MQNDFSTQQKTLFNPNREIKTLELEKILLAFKQSVNNDIDNELAMLIIDLIRNILSSTGKMFHSRQFVSIINLSLSLYEKTIRAKPGNLSIQACHDML